MSEWIETSSSDIWLSQFPYWVFLLAQKHLSLWITSLQEEGHYDSVFFCQFHSKDCPFFYDTSSNCSNCCTFNSFLAALYSVSIDCEYEILQAFFHLYSSEYFCFFFIDSYHQSFPYWSLLIFRMLCSGICQHWPIEPRFCHF